MSSGNTVNRINTRPVGKHGEIVEKKLQNSFNNRHPYRNPNHMLYVT